MNSERAISSVRRQGCLQSRKAAPCSTARRRSRNEKGKVAPFQRQRERKQEGKGDERGRMWRGMMERGPWRKMRVAERRGWRDADGSVLLPPLHPLAALSRFPTPAGFHPCEPPSTFRLALPGVEKPRNITHSRWASLFSLLLPFSPPPPYPGSPLLLRSALRSPYLQPSSSLPWRTGSSRSRLFIHSRFSQNNIQFCDSLDRYLERFDESASERIPSR